MSKIVNIKSKVDKNKTYEIVSKSFSKLVYDNYGYYYGSFHTGKDNQELLFECDNHYMRLD